MKYLVVSAGTLAILSAAFAVNAAMLLGDATKGEKLHNKHCVKCHTSSVYTRKPRKVNTVEGLIGRVKMCNDQLQIKLTEAQLEHITSFLDERYYKFD